MIPVAQSRCMCGQSSGLVDQSWNVECVTDFGESAVTSPYAGTRIQVGVHSLTIKDVVMRKSKRHLETFVRDVILKDSCV